MDGHNSGWMPAFNSIIENTLPFTATSPLVAGLTPARIFSKVLLPAPLAPITPKTSPQAIFKEISLSAQG